MASSSGEEADYDRLSGAKVKKTISSLSVRIQEFLPVSKGLPAVATELHAFVTELQERSGKTALRRRWLTFASRALVALVLGLAILATWSALKDAFSAEARLKGFEWLTVLESGINDLVFAGIAIWFLTSFVARLERAELLKRLHHLRSLAHIIDMHQMSKNVSEIESMTTGMSRKIWQKISLLHDKPRLPGA